MEENLQNREEELSKLEKLHKQALDKKVEEYHRSTKTTLKLFEPVHFWLRDHIKWYYKWHSSKFSTFAHWSFLIISILSLFYLSFILKEANDYKSSIPQKDLLVIGSDEKTQGTIELEDKSNINNEKTKIELDDKEITVGFIRKKANLGDMVSWKDIQWSADIPEGTSIVYRFKVANEDRKELWEKIPWSAHYKISCGKGLKNEGIPEIKSVFLKIEITLSGNENKTPSLNYLKIGYTPFHENEIVAFLRDKLVGGIAKIFKFLEKREGIQ